MTPTATSTPSTPSGKIVERETCQRRPQLTAGAGPRNVQRTRFVGIAASFGDNTAAGIGRAVDLLDHLEYGERSQRDEELVTASRPRGRAHPTRPYERTHDLRDEAGGGAEFLRQICTLQRSGEQSSSTKARTARSARWVISSRTVRDLPIGSPPARDHRPERTRQDLRRHSGAHRLTGCRRGAGRIRRESECVCDNELGSGRRDR